MHWVTYSNNQAWWLGQYTVAMLLGMQAVPRSILMSSTFFLEDSVMKILSLLLIQEEQFSVNNERMYANNW